jgi:hypothetical protein
MRVLVFIPTLGRPHQVEPLAANILADERCVPVFIVEASDTASQGAVSALKGDAVCLVNKRSPTYAGAINTAVDHYRVYDINFWYFFGADDLLFHPDWLDATLSLVANYRVIGTNDLGNPEVLAGTHATHSLVAKTYAEIGCVSDPGFPLHEGYAHNWCDTEFIDTAKARGEFTPCLTSIVEHRHWAWNKSKVDDTYQKAMRLEGSDRALYQSRRHLWNGM